jgi:hypothetical protein
MAYTINKDWVQWWATVSRGIIPISTLQSGALCFCPLLKLNKFKIKLKSCHGSYFACKFCKLDTTRTHTFRSTPTPLGYTSGAGTANTSGTHQLPHPVFSSVRVAWSLIFCVSVCRLLLVGFFYSFFVAQCFVCPSIYCIILPFSYIYYDLDRLYE